MGIHWQELVLVLLLVLVLFGPKRLPEIGRSLGNGIREFRDSMGGKEPTPVRADDAPRASIPVEVETAATVASEPADHR